MKRCLQLLGIIAIGSGAYFLTLTSTKSVDGQRGSVDTTLELLSPAEASSPGRSGSMKVTRAECQRLGAMKSHDISNECGGLNNACARRITEYVAVCFTKGLM